MYKRHDAVITAVALLGLLAPAVAGATTITRFSTGSIILPVDACYARSLGGPGNDADVDLVINNDPNVPATTQTALACDTKLEKDDGALWTYGLVMRLVRNGVPVYWIIRPAKTGWHDVDFQMMPGAPGLSAVTRMGYFSPNSEVTRYRGITVQYRGGPFVISAGDTCGTVDCVTAAKALMNTDDFKTYGTNGVNPHLAKQDFDAPVFVKITNLPKVAILDVGINSDFDHGDVSTHVQAMSDVGLAWGQNDWWFVMSPADMRAGKLLSENYQMLWVPPFDAFKANKIANYRAITDFLQNTGTGASTRTAGFGPGWVLFQDAAVWTMEGSRDGTTTTAGSWNGTDPNQPFDPNNPAGHSPTVLKIDGLPGTYGGNAATELMRSDDYSDPFAQQGGAPWQGVGGANKAEWQPLGGPTAYNAGVWKVVYSYHTTDASLRYWVTAAWRYFKNSPSYGRVLYTGGVFVRRNTFSPYRILLNSLLLQPAPTSATAALTALTSKQVTRAGPTVDAIGDPIVHTAFQGTFVNLNPAATATTYTGTASEATFDFPVIKGHFYGIDTDDFSGSVNYESLTYIFDADNYLKNLSTPLTTRKIFTTLGAGHLPGKQNVVDTDDSANALTVALSRPSPTANFTTAEARGLIRRILSGEPNGAGSRARLGGVDRSSAVIVGSSRIAGTARPTVIYFGATDGMIHAVCGNDTTMVAPCTAAGQELWAFIPKGQLGRLWNNTQRIDGSPGAVDAFEDFDGNGTREWKTILVFQTGNPYGQPEAYALDITNPDPTTTRGGFPPVSVIWQRDLPGTGLSTSLGPVQRGASFVYSAFFLTNNGRAPSTDVPNTAGIRVTAVDIKNGSYATGTSTDQSSTRGFSFSRQYPVYRASGTRTLDSTDMNALATAIPDGIAAVDLEDSGTITNLVFGTITGELYKIPANQTGTLSTTIEPFFAFEENLHPIGSTPTIYREVTGVFHAVVVTGGYVDPVMSQWPSATATTHQYAVAVDLGHTGATIVQTVGMSTRPNGMDWSYDMGSGDRAYASATRIGDKIFITTQDTPDDVNAASYGLTATKGKLHELTLQGALVGDAIQIAGGATSVSIVPNDRIYVAGAQKFEEIVAPVAIGEGRSAELTYIIKNIRKLWLKLE